MTTKIIIWLLGSLLILLFCFGTGSVAISFADQLRIMSCAITGRTMPADLNPSYVSIFLQIRLPRTLMAFLVGGALSVSGCIMQATLQNPLASSYTLGISSGASVGAALVILSDISVPVLGAALLPAGAFLFGLGTVFLVILVTQRLDRGLQSGTIILIGMAISMFVNAILTLLSSLAGERARQIQLWQMGSFSGKRWEHVLVMAVVCGICMGVVMRYHREMDIMTFGDEQALSLGVSIKQLKKRVLILATVLTGFAVCFSGVIGFVDLIVPHAIRRMFGARHKVLLPMSFIIGGAFMAASDLVARTIVSPSELAVGAVTAMIGAPVFILLYIKSRKG